MWRKIIHTMNNTSSDQGYLVTTRISLLPRCVKVEGWWAGEARPEGEPMEEIEKFREKIESAKTQLPEGHKDSEWMDGFNHGLDWALRILDKDKSAY